MALTGRTRAGATRLSQSSWETRLAVGIPLVLALLSVPTLLGAFSSAPPEGVVGTAGYGPPPTTTLATLPPTTTTTVPAAGVSPAAVEANPALTG
jgi:hypothetical protein